MKGSDAFLIAVICCQILGRKKVLHRANFPETSQLHYVLSEWKRAFGRIWPHALEFDVSILGGRGICAV